MTEVAEREILDMFKERGICEEHGRMVMEAAKTASDNMIEAFINSFDHLPENMLKLLAMHAAAKMTIGRLENGIAAAKEDM